MARLLTLVPYLHARGEVRLEEAARDARACRRRSCCSDLRVLLMCGLPGGYPDDLIDVDLDALEDPEGDGVIRVSNADYLARPLRLTRHRGHRPHRGAAGAAQRVRRRRPARSSTGRWPSWRRPRPRATRPAGSTSATSSRPPRRAAGDAQRRRTPTAPGAADLLRPDPRRGVRARGRPSRGRDGRWVRLPRRVLPQRRGAPAVPARPHPPRRACSTARSTEPAAPRQVGDGFLLPAGDTRLVRLRLAPQARWVPDYYPTESVRRRAGGALEVTMRVADQRWLERLPAAADPARPRPGPA